MIHPRRNASILIGKTHICVSYEGLILFYTYPMRLGYLGCLSYLLNFTIKSQYTVFIDLILKKSEKLLGTTEEWGGGGS